MPELWHPLKALLQEKALKITTLREIEPLVQRSDSGADGSPLEACCAAVEQHLSDQPYSQQVCAGQHMFGLAKSYPQNIQYGLRPLSSLGQVACFNLLSLSYLWHQAWSQGACARLTAAAWSYAMLVPVLCLCDRACSCLLTGVVYNHVGSPRHVHQLTMLISAAH